MVSEIEMASLVGKEGPTGAQQTVLCQLRVIAIEKRAG